MYMCIVSYRIEYVSYRQGRYRTRIDTAADRIVPALIINCRHIDRTHLDRNNRYFVTETVGIIVTAKHTK